jgi:hypothetical protein
MTENMAETFSHRRTKQTAKYDLKTGAKFKPYFNDTFCCRMPQNVARRLAELQRIFFVYITSKTVGISAAYVYLIVKVMKHYNFNQYKLMSSSFRRLLRLPIGCSPKPPTLLTHAASYRIILKALHYDR